MDKYELSYKVKLFLGVRGKSAYGLYEDLRKEAGTECEKNNIRDVPVWDQFRQGLFLFKESAKCYESGFNTATALMCRTTVRYFLFEAINKIGMQNVDGPDKVKELTSKYRVVWGGSLDDQQTRVRWDTLTKKAVELGILKEAETKEIYDKVIRFGDRAAHIDEKENLEIRENLDKAVKDSKFAGLNEGEISGPIMMLDKAALKFGGGVYEVMSEKDTEICINATKTGIVSILANYFKRADQLKGP